MREYAITSYPLSEEFRSRFEACVSASPRYLPLAELRRLPVTSLVRKLRSLGGERVFVPLEDESSRVLLPVLHGLAALTRSKRIEVVSPDLTRAALSRWRAGWALAGAGSEKAESACCCSAVRLARSASGKRSSRGIGRSGTVLMFGVLMSCAVMSVSCSGFWRRWRDCHHAAV